MRWLTRKYLQERFEEHNLKVSCLYPEVHDRLKKQTFPAALHSYMLHIDHIVCKANKNIRGSGYPTYPKFLHVPSTLIFFLQILKMEENSRTK